MCSRPRATSAHALESNPGHDVGVVVVYVFAAVVSLVGAAVWIGLLIWAAKGDGEVQKEHERDARGGD